MTATNFTVPGMDKTTADKVIAVLDQRMVALIDLGLTLKHVHWNVVGPNFIAVHEMLDPQVTAVQEMVDAVAERIATLGGIPVGTPGAIVGRRGWDDYSLQRALANEHLAALDVVYTGLIEDQRSAVKKLSELDAVSEDLLTGHAGDLELFQWFIRAHLESSGGELPTEGVSTEKGAAGKVS
ncbi:DNA starvation/stationary phase protection protein Dps [Parahaliea aestuarii]|uniref:DNA starvation/stationary phase protection protein Dps n=1 Tax=Parahaliea aestuarii TaxID=1852021 RepID=A0A5C9A1Y6_9GAMM|nr:DNA starvation/stationary phase protection protein Dps [Parahaliea aestuarii]TXS94855.1 DNA starvation/stationary phase protection protein Dps [Parahaliea aestuarii]